MPARIATPLQAWMHGRHARPGASVCCYTNNFTMCLHDAWHEGPPSTMVYPQKYCNLPVCVFPVRTYQAACLLQDIQVQNIPFELAEFCRKPAYSCGYTLPILGSMQLHVVAKVLYFLHVVTVATSISIIWQQTDRENGYNMRAASDVCSLIRSWGGSLHSGKRAWSLAG